MSMCRRALVLAIVTIGFINSCNNDVSITKRKSNLSIDEEAIRKYKWTYLSDTTQGEVYYLQLNFFKSPEENYVGAKILNYLDSVNNIFLLLNNQQRTQLAKIIIDSTNFSEGDCGTFHLNAGFIVVSDKKITATIDVGCAYNQWNFSPQNSHSKYGVLNEKGFREMEKLLDNINLSITK